MAFSGTFGYELDPTPFDINDIRLYSLHSTVYAKVGSIIRDGDLYRLWNPFKVSFASWMYVSRDLSESVVFAFSMNSDHWSNLVPRLKLQGLDKNAEYVVSEPVPNNMGQEIGNFKIKEIETPLFQLGYSRVILTGLTNNTINLKLSSLIISFSANFR